MDFTVQRWAQIAAVPAGLSSRVVLAAPMVPPVPLRVGAAMLELFGQTDKWVPAPYHSTVFTAEQATVVSSAGIIGLRGGVLAEDTLDHTDPVLDGYTRLGGHVLRGADGHDRDEGGTITIHATPAPLAGHHLSLLLPGHANHFHWLLMNVARLALLGPAERDVDSVLVPDGLAPAQRELVARLLPGVPLHSVRRGTALLVERLVLPWRVAGGDGVNPAAIAFLRALFPTSPGGPRRIYLTRQAAAARPLVNEAELIIALHRAGVVPVAMEALTLAQQAETTGAADLIVAPHGAGLANLAFARPGTRVVELLPATAPNWCYRHLAAAASLPYDCVLGRGAGGDAWIVSPTHVLSAIEGLA